MIKKEQIIEAVKSIPTIAEREKWVLTLDQEEGALFYSPKIIPDDAELHQVTDEYALYLDKDLNPKGVMVECHFLKALLETTLIKEADSSLILA